MEIRKALGLLNDQAMTGRDTIRTVEVLPPSARGEARLVLRAAAAIVFGALFVIGLRAGDGGPASGPGTDDLLPFQMLFRDAPAGVQRMYREMQEGLLETESIRAATKQWPAIDTLAAQGIPPFALTRPPYRWSLVQDGVFVNYVGVREADGPAFLALVQEPGPDAVDTGPPAPLDEVHHRLADGTLLHVSIWFRAAAAAAPTDPVRVLTQPFAAGWTQILVGRQGP